jgi:hypothetical protein
MLPLITHYNRRFRNTKIYPLYLYTEELLGQHGFHRYDSRRVDPHGFTMEFFDSVTKRLQTRIITENPFPPVDTITSDCIVLEQAPIDTNLYF